MKITGVYSHKGGEKYIKDNRPGELQDICDAVAAINTNEALSKLSRESTKPSLLFSPSNMNHQIKTFLSQRGWTQPAPDSKKGFTEPRIYLNGGREFREMDGIKNQTGLEVQFGKYAFMGYDIFSKMPIFKNHGLIDCGIELVVMPSMIKNMSTGVSSYSQIVTDMVARGEADIDLPTLILGIEPTDQEWQEIEQKRVRHAGGHEFELNGLTGTPPGPKP